MAVTIQDIEVSRKRVLEVMTNPEGTDGAETYEMRSERLRGLSLDEVNKRLDTLIYEFGETVGHYSGPLSRFRRELKPEDLETLTEAMGDLLPFGLNDEVQRQVLTADPEADNSGLAFYRIGSLTENIMLFMARFENTGVTLVKPEQS